MNAYWKIGLFLAYSIAAFTAGWHVESWRAGLLAARIEEAQQAQTINAENAVLKEEHSDQQKTNEVSHAYQTHISAIDAQYATAIAGLQSGASPTGPSLPAIPQGPSRCYAASGSIELSGRVKEALLNLAKQADIQTARLVSCQSWIKVHGG